MVGLVILLLFLHLKVLLEVITRQSVVAEQEVEVLAPLGLTRVQILVEHQEGPEVPHLYLAHLWHTRVVAVVVAIHLAHLGLGVQALEEMAEPLQLPLKQEQLIQEVVEAAEVILQTPMAATAAPVS
jgi:hypothetical protein